MTSNPLHVPEPAQPAPGCPPRCRRACVAAPFSRLLLSGSESLCALCCLGDDDGDTPTPSRLTRRQPYRRLLQLEPMRRRQHRAGRARRRQCGDLVRHQLGLRPGDRSAAHHQRPGLGVCRRHRAENQRVGARHHPPHQVPTEAFVHCVPFVCAGSHTFSNADAVAQCGGLEQPAPGHHPLPGRVLRPLAPVEHPDCCRPGQR